MVFVVGVRTGVTLGVGVGTGVTFGVGVRTGVTFGSGSNGWTGSSRLSAIVAEATCVGASTASKLSSSTLGS